MDSGFLSKQFFNFGSTMLFMNLKENKLNSTYNIEPNVVISIAIPDSITDPYPEYILQLL